MNLTRRRFIALTTATAATTSGLIPNVAAAGPTSGPSAARSPPPAEAGRVIDAGPVADFAPGQVSAAFRDDGFFVVRRDRQLFALSSACTHRACKVSLQDDQSYVCKCHGSRFAPAGEVLNGPADRNLPRLAVRRDGRGHLLVDLDQKIETDRPEPA